MGRKRSLVGYVFGFGFHGMGTFLDAVASFVGAAFYGVAGFAGYALGALFAFVNYFAGVGAARGGGGSHRAIVAHVHFSFSPGGRVYLLYFLSAGRSGGEGEASQQQGYLFHGRAYFRE
jgi:hypothetical protein